ncbi:hypothetical protein D1155_12915 [Anaerotruncus sp. 80]|uniref:Gram-positive cocci surface proteins LPxTG domain-containing protein n=3 Tax=Anaerotruncus TaxID=244127 RepID=A0A845QRA2_9FIRM|nr:hypothetical protein [Anaerotruncus colihominis]NCF03203.1 hypothetical protein [Anaerotruncus sp. 80]
MQSAPRAYLFIKNMGLLLLSYFRMRKEEQMKGKTLVKKVVSVLLCLMVVLAYATGFHDIFRVNAEEHTVTDSRTEQNDADKPAYDDGLFGENSLNDALMDGSMKDLGRIVVASWTWVDDDGLLTYDKKTEKWYLDTAADAETPITAEVLEGCFPQSIQAVLADGTKKELKITWDFSSLGDGVTKGEHTLQASLPEGYILAEDTEGLAATINLGGSIMMAAEETQEGQVTAGGLTITGKGISEGNGVTVGTDPAYGAYIQIETDTPVTIAGTSATHNIWIKENTTANITLDGVSISETAYRDSPINLLDGSSCNLTLAEGKTNTLSVAKAVYAAALHVGVNSTLTVDGSGTLDATGGLYSSAIGAGYSEIAGKMYFNGGTINATAVSTDGGVANGGAGIGAGCMGGSSYIEINGGRIWAQGAYHAAGVGAGYGNTAYNEGSRQHGAVTGANRSKYYLKCGDITINGGYIESHGGEHGGAFGAACVTTAQGCTIRVTGGTLLARPVASMYAFDGNGGTVYITGGSVDASVGQGFRMGNNATYALDANGGKVFMTTIDLSAEGFKDNVILPETWEVSIAGSKYTYGAPYSFDKGKLYLWVPEASAGKTISVECSYLDKNGEERHLEPMYIEEADKGGGSVLKRYVDFILPEDKFPGPLSKDYDGYPLEKYDFEKEGNAIIAEDKAGNKKELNKNSDGKGNNYITVFAQRYDKVNGTPMEEEASTGNTYVMPENAGIYKFKLISKQYANEVGFKESYWGHRTTGWATIRPIPSVIVDPTYDIQTEIDDDTGQKIVTEMTFHAQVKTAKPKKGAAYKAPDGILQFYVNGVKVGAPIKANDAKYVKTEKVGDDTYEYTDATLTVDFNDVSGKYPAIPKLESGKFIVEAKYTGGYNYEPSSKNVPVEGGGSSTDEPDNFPFINPPIPVIPNGVVDPDDPDSEPDGKKLNPDEIERIEDGTDILRLRGTVNDSISRKTEKGKTVTLDELETLFDERYVFVGLDGRLLKGVTRSAISIVDKAGNPVTEIDLSNAGKYIVTQTVTDALGNETVINLTYNVRKPSLIDPDLNKDTNDDGIPDINIDTDGDGKPDVDIDTDDDGKPDINKDTDGDGKPDVDIDTDGDGKPDVNVDTDGDGKPDINKDTDGDGKPDVDIDTNGDGKPDINIDTNGDGKPDLDIDKDGDGKPDLNVDTDGDGKPDINIDKNGDGKPDVNIDTNGDGKPDVNIDTDGDGKPDINIDKNGDGKPDVNIDTNGDGKPDINIDTDGDGKPDINVDTNGDGKPDVNIDTDGDGKPDINIDTDGDGIPDLNVDIDGDGIPDINIDTDGDGIPDKNIKTPEEVENIIKEQNPETDELPWWIPRTGDAANMLAWLAVLVAAAIGLGGTAYAVKKKYR